jgi:hypothetical protein
MGTILSEFPEITKLGMDISLICGIIEAGLGARNNSNNPLSQSGACKGFS